MQAHDLPRVAEMWSSNQSAVVHALYEGWAKKMEGLFFLQGYGLNAQRALLHREQQTHQELPSQDYGMGKVGGCYGEHLQHTCPVKMKKWTKPP